MSMTRSRDRAYATREAASTRRTRSTGRGGPRFLLYSGVNQPSHGGTGTPTADPAGGSTGLGRSGPPTHPCLPTKPGANPLRRAQPRLRAGVLHPFNYTTRKYVPQAHNPPPNGGRSTGSSPRSPSDGSGSPSLVTRQPCTSSAPRRRPPGCASRRGWSAANTPLARPSRKPIWRPPQSPSRRTTRCPTGTTSCIPGLPMKCEKM